MNAIAVYILEGVLPYRDTVGVVVIGIFTLPDTTISTGKEIAGYPGTLLGSKKNQENTPMRPVGT